MYNQGTTAFLGDGNSYSHEAAVRMAGGALRGYPTMGKVIAAAMSGECERAVLPMENNVEGAVNEVYDAVFDCGLFITRQLVLPVHHSLIAAAGATVAGLQRIASHPQAIAQCRKFLDTLSVPVVAVASTSAALALADEHTAAIAFKPMVGQAVLASGIQDSSLNATRFALFERTCALGGSTVSVAFDLKNRPGTLLSALEAINSAGVNMTRILSRPHRSGDGQYRFFVDFDYYGGEAELKAFLGVLSERTALLRLLGRYDVTQAQL